MRNDIQPGAFTAWANEVYPTPFRDRAGKCDDCSNACETLHGDPDRATFCCNCFQWEPCETCVKRESLTMSATNRLPDCYDYVRRYYNVPAYIGVRVRVGDKEGVIVKATGSQQYVYIRLDGQKHANPYHPTDGIEYRTVAKAEERKEKQS